MEVKNSAYKHGFDNHDIEHALDNAIRLVEYDYHGEDRLLIIGPSPTGVLLELVAVPADDPVRIIHCDELQRSREHYLR